MIAALALAYADWAEAPLISGTAEVVDGDGLKLGAAVFRLHGIDAPEIAQHCRRPSGEDWAYGSAASTALAALIAGGSVVCEPLDRDRYDRIIARCLVNGEDIGGKMIDLGLAWAFTRYSDDYVGRKMTARASAIGIWQAETDPAWEYRARRWTSASVAAPPEGCPIKGNINRKGEHIYHMPWSASYARTRIDEAEGERWFCDEAAAQDTGWRPPRTH